MTDTTHFGLDRSTVRRAGLLAVFVVAASLLFVQPELSARGLGWVGIALQVPFIVIIIWSLIEDFRHLRAQG